MKSRIFIQVLSLVALAATYVSIVGADGGCGGDPECVDVCVTAGDCCVLVPGGRATGICVENGDLFTCGER